MPLRWNAGADNLTSDSPRPSGGTFSFCMWTYRIGTPPATWGHYAGLIDSGQSSYVQFSSNGNDLNAYSGKSWDGNIGNPGNNVWAFIAGQTNGTAIWYGRSAIGSRVWDQTATTATEGEDFTVSDYAIGGNESWGEGVNARLANFKAWGSVISTDELLAEKRKASRS